MTQPVIPLASGSAAQDERVKQAAEAYIYGYPLVYNLHEIVKFPAGAAALPAAGAPQPDPQADDELKWWETFRAVLAAFPPPAADAPFINPDPALKRTLLAGQAAGQAKIEALVKTAAQPVNGWQSSKNLFSYNLDFFEIGALDAPEWEIADRATAYVTRAAAARAGLWGNHGYEADYENVYVDADNQALDAAHRYELRLPAIQRVA